MSLQAPRSVVMVRPHHFSVNTETAADNVFQSTSSGSADDIAGSAFDETTALADALIAHGVRVHVFDDETTDRPDSVFPNNWFSTHTGGRVAVYPMRSLSRRAERRTDVLDMLKEQYRVQDLIDYSGLEHDGLFLEGTGAMVLDHLHRIAYVARSNRADAIALERFCTHFGFEPMAFDAFDAHGVPIYHTNVLMCLGTSIALICLDAIHDEARRDEIRMRLVQSERTIIDLSQRQLREFAGNAFELTGGNGRLLVMSARAHRSLTSQQVAIIETGAEIVAVDIPTIELAGGSVRCMLAGVHLDPRPLPAQTGPALATPAPPVHLGSDHG